jgi:hypothetical protein
MIRVVLACGLLCGSIALLAAASCGDAACHDNTCEDPSRGGGGIQGSSGGGAPALADQYCSCMQAICHDAYHDKFGPPSDEPAAAAACLAEASGLPEAGQDVDSGNFIECRLHHCQLGAETEAACDAMIGLGACAPPAP